MLHTSTAYCYTRIKKWGITALTLALLALPVQAQSQADFKQALKKKQQAIGQKKVSFTVQELEALGVQTIGESMDVLTKLVNPDAGVNQQSGASKQVKGDNGADVTAILSTLRLDDIDRIEISRDGEKIKYHLSRAISKDGVTATFSFSIIDERFKQSKLDPVVTTATKAPVRSSELGDIVQVIDGSELEALNIRTVKDALNTLSDVNISEASGIQTVFLRGMANGNTKVLYNGMDLKDVTDINGAPKIESLPITGIDRIEIVPGSAGVMYGSGASAGVINIIPKKNQTKGLIETELGDQHHVLAIQKGLQIKGYDINLTASHLYNKTLSERENVSIDELDAIKKQNVNIAIDKRIAEGKLSTLLMVEESTKDTDYGMGTSPETNHDPNAYAKFKRLSFQALYNKNFSSKLHTRFKINSSKLNRESIDLVDEHSKPYIASGARFAGGSYIYESQLLNLGVENALMLTQQQSLNFGAIFVKEQGDFNTGTKPLNKNQNHTGIYAQHRWLNPWLNTQLGGRIERYKSGSDSETKSTYQALVFKDIDSMGLHMSAGIKEGFKLPTLYQKYDPNYGNEDLLAEKSLTKEISLSKKIKKSKTTLSYFDTTLANKIDFNANWKYENVSKEVNLRGFEYAYFLTDIKRIKFLRVSYTDYKPSSAVQKVPDYKLSTVIGLEKNKWQTAFMLNNVGRTVGMTGVPSYTVINSNIKYNYSAAMDISLSINNIFDKDYQTVAGYSEPGRTLYLGAKYRF
eukprot:COSAG01_NODE_5139_length_4460_cov_2.397386_4_plen_748_part_00